MKLHPKLPGGGEIHFERPPMDPDRFEGLCWLIGGLGAGTLFVRLLTTALA